MFAGLRHHRLVGSHYEQHKVDPSDPCQHVLDESLMSGNIDKSHLHVAEIQMRKTEVDGDSPEFFFLQAVRIRSGERLYQGALPVINVTRRACNHVSHVSMR